MSSAFKNPLLARTILLVVGIASTSCAMVHKPLRACVGAHNPLQPFARLGLSMLMYDMCALQRAESLGSSMLMYDMCALQRVESLARRRLGLCILPLAL